MNQEIGKLTRIPLEGFQMNYQCTLYKNNVLNFFPLEKEKEIHVFDIETRKIQKIKLENLQEMHDFRFVVHWKENKFILTGGKEYIKADKKHNKISIASVLENKEENLDSTKVQDKSALKFEIHTLEFQMGNVYPNHIQVDQGNLYFEVTDCAFHAWTINSDEFKLRKMAGPGEDPKNLRVFCEDKSYFFPDFKKKEKCSSCKHEKPIHSNQVQISDLDNSSTKTIGFSDKFEFASDHCSIQVRNGLIYFFSEISEIWLFDPQSEKMRKARTVGERLPYGPVVSAKYEDSILLWEKKSNTEIFLLTFEDSSSYDKQDSKAGKEILSSLEKLLEEKSFTDVIFLVEDQEIPAHRCILLQSIFFKNMFNSGMVEAKSNKIPMPGISVAAFQALLKFLYCGQVNLDNSLASELIVQADKFSLSSLKSLCELELKKTINISNLVGLAQIAEKVEATNLQSCIAQFIAKNFSNLEAEVKIDEIPQKLFIKALSILSSNSYN